LRCARCRIPCSEQLAADRGAAALWPFAAYLIYALGTGIFAWWRTGMAAAYVLAPIVLVASASKLGAWQGYAAMLIVALPTKLGWLRAAFPFPESRPIYALTVLMGINIGHPWWKRDSRIMLGSLRSWWVC